MRRIIILLLSIVLFTGCGNRDKNNEIVFWTMQMGDFAPYINKVVQEYEQKNTNIKIKWIDIPFSEAEKRTLVAVMSDNPPDLINLNPDFSTQLAQKGTLWEIETDKLDSFVQEIVEALKYDNKSYSIPWYATSAITIYNKGLLQQSKLKFIPKTYDELASVAKQIKTNTNKGQIYENKTWRKILCNTYAF